MNPSRPDLEHFRRFRHNRAVALFALLALLFATTAYVAHGLQHDLPLSQHATAHCDLCLQFSSTAGTPDHVQIAGKPPLAAFTPKSIQADPVTSLEHPTHRLPRGPPV